MDTIEMLTHLTDQCGRSVEPSSSLQRLLSWSQSLLVRRARGQDWVQDGSTLCWHVHGAHPTVQRCLLLLQLLGCLSGLSNSNINADNIHHCQPSYGWWQGGWRWLQRAGSGGWDCRSQRLQARGSLPSGETWGKLAPRLDCLPRWRGLATLEKKQEVATQQRKASRSWRCGPSFHLLHQQVYLLRLDPTAAAALQMKVATTKVQAECRWLQQNMLQSTIWPILIV